MKGVVCVSGGVDSTTLLALAIQECTAVLGLSFRYGQKHTKEVEHARAICLHYGVPHTTLDVPHLFKGAGSTLVEHDKPIPHLSYAQLREAQGPSPTYVPFRNGTFLSLATIVALTQGYDAVYIGAHADDAHNWAYPDCTPQFLGAMANAIYIGTYYKVSLRFPFAFYTKADIIRLGAKLGVPWAYTWSCYEGRERHCGLCPACVSRKEAFRVAGILDPTVYEEEKA
ncbi:MAG: 7-cyano-7-deazaguanine synthase QueC [Candidatus Caldarchaeum sp.]